MRVMHVLFTFTVLAMTLVYLNFVSGCSSKPPKKIKVKPTKRKLTTPKPTTPQPTTPKPTSPPTTPKPTSSPTLPPEKPFEKCPKEPIPGLPINTVMYNGDDSSDGKFIIDGSKEDIKKFPFAVQLYHMNTRLISEYKCSGTIISTRIVLSAGHCFLLDRPDIKIYILAGSSKLNEGEKYEINVVKRHPDYQFYESKGTTYAYANIAAFQTGREIQFTDFIKAVKLPTSKEKFGVGTMATVLGWGKVSKKEKTLSAVLMGVNLPFLSSEDCRRAYKHLINKYVICGGYQKGMKGICTGDSGGPVVVNGTLFGINTWSLMKHECSPANCPSLFVNIKAVIGWIKEVI